MEAIKDKVLPLLLTRKQAADYLGIDPITFDKVFRHNQDFHYFMLGKQQRYTVEELMNFVRSHLE